MIPIFQSWAGLLGVSMLAVCASGCSSSSDRAMAESQAIAKALGNLGNAGWKEDVAVGVGPVALGLVRAGVAFGGAPEEARLALDSLHGVQVSVYGRYKRAVLPPRGQLLDETDEILARRQWERVIGVIDGSQMVAVYTPREPQAQDELAVCVVVVEPREMVVVFARADLEPIMELALQARRTGSRPRALGSYVHGLRPRD